MIPKEESAELTLRFGEMVLYSRHVNLNILNRDLDCAVNQTFTPVKTPKTQGWLLRSVPYEQGQKTISYERPFLKYIRSHYNRYFIDLDGTFEQYTKKFSKKSLSGFSRKKRQMEKNTGPITFKSYKTPEEITEFYRLARALSSKTYQEIKLNCGLPKEEEYFKNLLIQSQQNQVRAFLLLGPNNTPIAYLLCPGKKVTLEYQYLGYDPKYAKWSPGTLLQMFALEEVFKEGKFKYFDFTQGEGQHKSYFSTHKVSCADILYLNCNLNNLLFVACHFGFEGFSKNSVRLLNLLGLKSKVKRFLRRC